MLMKRKGGVLKAILIAGLIAGTLDITAACIQYYIVGNKDLSKLFKFIASGVFGKEAFTGGAAYVWLGLLFHYMIAYIFTAIFFALYPPIYRLIRSTILAGLLYGAFIWVIMSRVVLPLSNAPTNPFNLTKAMIAMAILMFMIGVPVSIMAYKYYAKRGLLNSATIT